jgi:hypothetical protein
LKVFAHNHTPKQIDARDNGQMKHVILKIIFLLCLSCLSFISFAEENNAWNPCPYDLSQDQVETDTNSQKRWNVSLSPYTHHWRYSPDHKPVVLAALERRLGQ